jgi:DNA topoisomerase-1
LPVRVRIGRYGVFLQMGESSDEGPRASVSDDHPPADLTLDKALEILKAKAAGPRTLGTDPKTGHTVYVMVGRFGPYVQLGETPDDKKAEKPRRASLGRRFSEDAITLDQALQLLSLPRELGAADDGEVIVANVGRFGPYVKHGSEFRSLDADDDVYTITLERAKELLAKEKKSIRRQRAAAKELRVIGEHPDTKAPLKILDGRYGPYVTDGTTNASLPKGTAPESVSMDDAIGLLAARAGAARGPKRRATKTTGARKTAKKKTKSAALVRP